jgi:ATP-dependent helicase/nuclease subunit A
MAKFKDTREQALAKSCDRHLSVTANAGSGKTTVLVDRYLRLLIGEKGVPSQIDPKRIVAITFTKMAAMEMTNKIVEKLNERISETSVKTEISKLSSIRDKLTGAKISTIHSFCGSLLRDYPIEAGVQPNFVELSGSDLIKIQKISAFQAIENRLSSEDPEIAKEAREFIKNYGVSTVEAKIVSLLNRKSYIKKAESIYSSELTDLKRVRNKYLAALLKKVFAKIYTIIIYDFENLDEKVNKKFSNTRELVQQAYQKIEAVDSVDTAQISSALQFALDSLSNVMTKTDIYAPYKKCVEFTAISALIEYRARLNDINAAIEADKYDDEQFNQSTILYKFACDAIEIYEMEKAEVAGLDFDDLIEKTARLLDDEIVRRKIAAKIDYLLVDEFQDTDETQYSIIRRIVKEFDDENTEKPNNLFIVGDAKQSIYGFRNADVRVFEKAKIDIKTINKVKIEAGAISELFSIPSEVKGEMLEVQPENLIFSYGNLNLTSTFRLKPAIAAFVNLVCSNLFNEKYSNYDVDYEDLVCARDVNVLVENPTEIDKEFLGEISFLIAINKYKKRGDEEDDILNTEKNSEPTEEEIVVKYIQKILSETNYKLSDIGILSRTNKAFDNLSLAFIENGIPYINHSGAGFYAIPEIKDLISLLKFITNPGDDISFLSVLRSSICGFTNTELYTIANAANSISYYERFKALAKDDNPEHEYIARKVSYFLDAFEELIRRRLDLPVSLLISKAVERFNWFYTISDSVHADRIKINCDKFLDKTREFINKGFRNIYDFVEELKLIDENNVKEAEAAQKSSADAVNFMTIHASKGLEFPIVILYKTNNKKTTNHSGEYYDEDFGICFPFTQASDEAIFTSIKSSFQLTAALNQEYKELAEEKRILYVALTRARDILTISATLKENKDGFLNAISNSIFSSIIRGLGANINGLAVEGEFKAQVVTLPILYNYEQRKTPFRLSVKRIGDLDDISPINFTNDKIIHNYTLMPEPLSGDIRNETISASRIMSFYNNQDEYLQKYILGLPRDYDPKMEQIENDEDEYAELSAADFGTAIHWAMEHILDWLIDTKIDESALDNIADQALSYYSNLNPETKLNLIDICKKVAASELIIKNYDYLQSAEHEYKLMMPVGDDFIQGTIDLAINNENGETEVWDWKSNRISGSLVPTAKHYEAQMRLYSYLIYKLKPEQKSYKAKLLFVRLADNNASDKDWTYEFEWSQGDMLEYEQSLFANVKETKNYPFLISEINQ